MLLIHAVQAALPLIASVTVSVLSPVILRVV